MSKRGGGPAGGGPVAAERAIGSLGPGRRRGGPGSGRGRLRVRTGGIRQKTSNSRSPIDTPPTPTSERRPEGSAADLRLAQRAAAGEREAREQLAARLRCIPRFVAERNRRLGSPLTVEAVEEASQNVILEVWGRLGRFEGRSRIETWVYAFCRNETMNAVRRVQRDRWRVQPLSGPDGDVDPPVAVAVDRGLIDEDTASLLERLAPRESEVVRMRHFEDLALPEIAERLGLSVSSVKTHYYRGLTKLRAVLDPTPGERKVQP